jgi:hypothetical protein
MLDRNRHRGGSGFNEGANGRQDFWSARALEMEMGSRHRGGGWETNTVVMKEAIVLGI